MIAAMQQLIAMTVREVLQESDADEMTEHQLRMEVSRRLGVDLSLPKHKAVVSQAMQLFLEEEERAREDDGEASKDEVPEHTDSGDLIVCNLSRNRKVTVGNFNGKTLVSMREYYNKDGKEHPSRKGISLTNNQWSLLRNKVPAIEAAIKKMTPSS